MRTLLTVGKGIDTKIFSNPGYLGKSHLADGISFGSGGGVGCCQHGVQPAAVLGCGDYGANHLHAACQGPWSGHQVLKALMSSLQPLRA